jgi:hypothetical protein
MTIIAGDNKHLVQVSMTLGQALFYKLCKHARIAMHP